MAGLLDFLNTPESQLGIGLLAAAGSGQRFGPGVSSAMQGVQEQQRYALKQKFMQAQMDNYQSEIEARKLAYIRDARQQAWIQQLMGGSPQGQVANSSTAGGTPAASGPTPAASGPTPAASGPTPAASGPSGGGLLEMTRAYGIPQQAIQADMAFNGGKGIAAMLEKHGSRDMQVTNGYAYDKNLLGAGYLPQLSISTDGKATQVQIGPDGQPIVTAPRGAPETYGTYQGIEAGIRAANTPTKVYNPATQREEFVRQSDVLQGNMPNATGNPMLDAIIRTESNGNPNAISPKGAQGAMQVMPGTAMAPGFGIEPARDNSEAERVRVGSEYIGKLQERYGSPALAAIAYNWGPGNTDMWLKSGGDYNKLPQETKNYVSAVMTRHAVNSIGSGQPQGGNFAAGPSAQEAASAKFAYKLATEQADMLGNSYTAAGNAALDILGVQQARQAVQSGAFQGTGADLKLSVAKFGDAIGIPINPQKAANTDYLKSVLGQGLLEKAKTLGSNPSNTDASRINDIVGSIGKDPQAMNKILDWREEMARRAITLHNTKVDQATQSGYQAPYDMRVKMPDSAPAKILDSLPVANASNRGQRIRDTTTGKILVSNGMQWKEQ
ncbi:MAG: lytic transglycosylase domain-containing protein [Burkholderiales bacterium]|nr:lytic transglycosylase domain-containing protein [Burkholderiales bacterium]